MRRVALAALAAVLLAGCSSYGCTFEVRWNDPALVDALEPVEPLDPIPLDADGLPAAFHGATIQRVEWRQGTDHVVAHGRLVVVETAEGADPAPAFQAARALLLDLTRAEPREVDAVLVRLADGHTTVNTPDNPENADAPPWEQYRTFLSVPWAVRAYLDGHLDEVPVERVLHAGGYDLHVAPRLGRHPDLDLEADGFGAVTLRVRRDADDDSSRPAVEAAARAMVARAGLPMPDEVETAWAWGRCSEGWERPAPAE